MSESSACALPLETPFTKDKAGYLAAREYLERVGGEAVLMGLFETIERANMDYHNRSKGE